MSSRYVLIAIVVLLLAGVGVFLFSRDNGGVAAFPFISDRLAAFFRGAGGENAPPEDEEALEAPADSYRDEVRGFSFRAPGFLMQRIGEEAGEVLLVRKSEGDFSFQIFMTEFGEDEPLTASRIKRDLQDLVVEDALSVLIGEKKDIPALRFKSRDPAAGETLEVWFTHGGDLYAVTAPAGSDTVIGPILETIAFD
jgi:hypothetical protein